MPEATAAASTTAATAVNSSNDENNAAAIIPPAVDLSPFQVEKVAELRRELGDQLLTKTPLFNDDYSLVRWLNGWNYKIAEIVPVFERASRQLRMMGLNEFPPMEDVDEINEYCSRVSLGSPYFPEGSVIMVQCMGNSQPKTLVKCGRVSDCYRLGIIETMLAYRLIKLQEQKRRRKLGLRVIIDMAGFNTDHLTTFGMKAYSNLLRTLQAIFPDLLRQVYVINAPIMVSAAWNIVKQVLSEQTRSKVAFLGTTAQFRECLVADLGPENVFPKWGGQKPVGSKGDPEHGTIRIGGRPPDHIRKTVQARVETARGAKGELRKLCVPARGKQDVEVYVPQAGDHLHWYFTASSDIDFGVARKDGAEVWPRFRLNTEHVPEYGSMRCSSSGTYTLVFDNTFSQWFSKEVKYAVGVSRRPLDFDGGQIGE